MGQIAAVAAVIAAVLILARFRRGSWGSPRGVRPEQPSERDRKDSLRARSFLVVWGGLFLFGVIVKATIAELDKSTPWVPLTLSIAWLVALVCAVLWTWRQRRRTVLLARLTWTRPGRIWVRVTVLLAILGALAPVVWRAWAEREILRAAKLYESLPAGAAQDDALRAVSTLSSYRELTPTLSFTLPAVVVALSAAVWWALTPDRRR